MAILKFNNAAEELSLLGQSLDPSRNYREVAFQLFATGDMFVMGILRDDSSIPADKPRQRVHPLRFKVLVPEKVSLADLQVVIHEQTRHLA